MTNTRRIIILGGGFGGLYAARTLKSAAVDVTLIDRCNYHLFQPLLYQVATGLLSPSEIASPLRTILRHQKNTRVLLGEVAEIDPVKQQLTLTDGGHFAYDFLIVATGSRSSYYGHNEWEQWAPSLKSVEDATAIRRRLLFAFEAAERLTPSPEREAWLRFVIVGAGATGVELAGALAEIARHTLQHEFRSIQPAAAQIILLDGAPRVLMNFPEDLSKKAEQSLVKLGVHVRTGVMVRDIHEEGVALQTPQGGEHIATHTVIWAGGVTVSPLGKSLAARTGAETDKSGRIKVNPDLTLPQFPNLYIVGDLALALRADGKPFPGTAPVAMQQGAHAARAILQKLDGKTPPPFHYVDKGELAVIGRGNAVAKIFGSQLAGFPAWVIWVFVHLMYLVQFQNRLLVFIKWGFEYLTFNRGSRLITGQPLPKLHNKEP